MTDRQKTASGREVKRTGMNDKKMSALEKLKAAREGNLKRTDQYEVSLISKVLICDVDRSKRSRGFSRTSTAKSMSADRQVAKMTISSLTTTGSATRTTAAKSGTTTTTIRRSKTRSVGAKRAKNSLKTTRPSTSSCSTLR